MKKIIEEVIANENAKKSKESTDNNLNNSNKDNLSENPIAQKEFSQGIKDKE